MNDDQRLDFDMLLKGKRVRLVNTSDPYTKLRSGDLGTVKYQFKNLDKLCLNVKWDSGSNLSLIEGLDQYEILDD